MNVWEKTPLDLEFLEEYSMPISPAYLAEAKRETLVFDPPSEFFSGCKNFLRVRIPVGNIS